MKNRLNTDFLYKKAINLQNLSFEEGLYLYENAPTSELMFIANEIKKEFHPKKEVSWIIDRNVNITNVCISACKFCNYYRSENHKEAYITSMSEYEEKIKELFKLGGNQLLLQGGLHPKLNLNFYTSLFKELKSKFPELKLHALGPAEIVHLAKLENLDYTSILEALINAGLDSLPGAGAEILSDRVRSFMSKYKCNTDEWLNVMRAAHKLNLTTSATMMFGHYETNSERIEHILKIRRVQDEKPSSSKGFISFISWPFQDVSTTLKKKFNISNTVSSNEYVRTLAISRILLPNIKNIQASWLTVGIDTAQLCLDGGANDFGSIMIEENVVSGAGASYSLDSKGMVNAIKEAGFSPILRDQQFNLKNQ